MKTNVFRVIMAIIFALALSSTQGFAYGQSSTDSAKSTEHIEQVVQPNDKSRLQTADSVLDTARSNTSEAAELLIQEINQLPKQIQQGAWVQIPMLILLALCVLLLCIVLGMLWMMPKRLVQKEEKRSGQPSSSSNNSNTKEISQLRKELEDKDKELQDLKETIEKYKSEIQELESKYKTLPKQLDTAQSSRQAPSIPAQRQWGYIESLPSADTGEYIVTRPNGKCYLKIDLATGELALVDELEDLKDESKNDLIGNAGHSCALLKKEGGGGTIAEVRTGKLTLSEPNKWKLETPLTLVLKEEKLIKREGNNA